MLSGIKQDFFVMSPGVYVVLRLCDTHTETWDLVIISAQTAKVTGRAEGKERVGVKQEYETLVKNMTASCSPLCLNTLLYLQFILLLV